MHIIIGGAYNGKRQYVKNRFQPTTFIEGDFQQHTFQIGDIVAIGTFEDAIRPLLTMDEDAIVEQLFTKLMAIRANCTLICICTDMTRGIVPLDRDDRKIRDCCGRLYQRLCAEDAEVVRIWYGLPQMLKEKTI